MSGAVEFVPLVTRPKRVERISNVADLKRRLHHVSHLIRHPFRHARYVQATMGYAERGLLVDSAYRRYKYLGDYLSLSFTRTLRQECVLSHCAIVERHLTPEAAQAICCAGVELWRLVSEYPLISIRLTNSESAPMEGEWQLQFLYGGVIIGALSFTFATLPDCAVEGTDVCIIGGIQGGIDKRAEIRNAAKANGEISPAAMLILAVKALASALGIHTVLGVAQQHQVVRRYAAEGVKADYDAIWASEGASTRVKGMYLLSHQLVERDLMEVPRSHRRRTKLKRQRKGDIKIEIVETTRARLLRPS